MASGGACTKCRGNGKVTCNACQGAGVLRAASRVPGDPAPVHACNGCQKTGQIMCAACDGTGKQT